MQNPFSFSTATEILFGRGQSLEAAERIALLGRRVFLVHGKDPRRSERLLNELSGKGCAVMRFSIAAEPDIEMIETGIAIARNSNAQIVVAIGGGAVIDAGKAVAALVPAIRPMLDHLEVVGQGLPLDRPPLPFVAIPTTAGTGAEVTRNAVIGVTEHRRKVSLRDARMLPRLAIVDPALTDDCPRGITLASGLDAITQVIEPYISTRANPLTDALCRDAIPRGLAALRRLMESENAEARDDMSWVSLCGGLALANSGLGAVHGLAGPLGGLTGAAHGAICGALLPYVLMANHRAIVGGEASARLEEVGRWIGAELGNHEAGLADAAMMMADWSRSKGLRSLGHFGMNEKIRLAAAEAAISSSSMRANPSKLSVTDLQNIMLAAH